MPKPAGSPGLEGSSPSMATGRETKASRVAAEIETRIETGRLSAGAFLGTKSTLAADHAVSRQTVNEAVRLLQQRGLVAVRPGPGGGISVAASAARVALSKALLSAQDDPRRLAELFTVQDALHETICIEAAKSCTPEHAARILDAAAELDKARDSSERLLALWNVDREIAMAVPNTMLRSVYVLVLDLISSSLERWPQSDEVSRGTLAIHRETARAVAGNDLDAARSSARLHSPRGTP